MEETIEEVVVRFHMRLRDNRLPLLLPLPTSDDALFSNSINDAKTAAALDGRTISFPPSLVPPDVVVATPHSRSNISSTLPNADTLSLVVEVVDGGGKTCNISSESMRVRNADSNIDNAVVSTLLLSFLLVLLFVLLESPLAFSDAAAAVLSDVPSVESKAVGNKSSITTSWWQTNHIVS